MKLKDFAPEVRARLTGSSDSVEDGESPSSFLWEAADDKALGVDLPYPPSVNRMWRRVGNRTVLSREGRIYRQRVAWTCRDLRRIDGDVVVRIKVYRPAKRGDLDNCFKAILDSLRGLAFHDDSQVVRIEADRYDDKANPRVEVEVTAVGGGGDGRASR